MDLAIMSGVAGLVAKAAAFVHDATVTDEGFIRAYYLEVSQNIEILKTVDINSLKEKEIASPEFRSLINSLNTEVGAALLCTNIAERKRILSFLAQGLDIDSPPVNSFLIETGDDENADQQPVSHLRADVLKAVWFTVQKIELLKALSALKKQNFNTGFRLNVRMANINERFKLIRRKLAENDAMKSLR
jgi:hypothetical protein